MAREPDDLLDEIFGLDSEVSELPSLEKVYPELMLHQAQHANLYYGSLQQYTRQFVTTDSQNKVVQFHSSKLDTLLREKVNLWNNTDFQAPSATRGAAPSSPTASPSSAANSLFSWSTSDTLIAARKRQLQERSSNSQSLLASSETTDIKSPQPLPATTKRRTPVMQNIARVIERESSKFIQDRIDVIKAHHIKEASKKIDERKRKDHEMHLRRIKRKEEEYERSLKAAIALQNMNRQSGFFGTLFGLGLKQNSSSFTLDIWDLEPQAYPAPVPGSPTSAKSPSPLPAQNKRSSLLPFWLSPSKSSALKKKGFPSRTLSPDSTLSRTADTSFEGSSTRSIAGSEEVSDHEEPHIDALASPNGTEALKRHEFSPEQGHKNGSADFLSTPEKENRSMAPTFIAMEPPMASPTQRQHLTTEDLLQL